MKLLSDAVATVVSHKAFRNGKQQKCHGLFYNFKTVRLLLNAAIEIGNSDASGPKMLFP